METHKIIPDYYQISQEDFTKTKSLSYISIECQCCKNIFSTTKKNVLKGLTARGEFVSYCSAKCSSQIKRQTHRKDVTCQECLQIFSKTLAEIKKSENHFCSRSCATSFNNKIHIKRKLRRTCIECDNVVFTYRHIRCEKHHEEYKTSKYLNKTLREYRNRPSVQNKHPSWINSHIRLFAKSWNKSLTKLPCAKCKYDKHVELAHIKGIATYEDHALLSEINSKENIIQLCPNCHWEFDNEDRTPFKELLTELGKVYSDQ